MGIGKQDLDLESQGFFETKFKPTSSKLKKSYKIQNSK